MDSAQRNDLTAAMIREFNDLFPDISGRTHGMLHEVDVGDAGHLSNTHTQLAHKSERL